MQKVWREVDDKHEPPIGEPLLVWFDPPFDDVRGLAMTATYAGGHIGWQFPDALNRYLPDLTCQGWCITHWQDLPAAPPG